MSHHNSASPSATPRYFEGSPDDYRLTWRWALAIALFGAVLLSVRLGDVRVLTFHEVVFATPAKEMLQSGQWIVPTIAGDPFNDRTPMTAWTIAASMWLFGTDAEWAVRAPNVLFSIAAALLMASMAARWFGKRAGILAGFIELTTLQVLTNGRLAEADMLLCATVTASMYAFAAATVDGPRGVSRSRLLPYAFYGFFAASFMVKWLFGPAFIGTGCFAYALLARDRKVWRFLFHPGGIAFAALLTVPWMIAAYRVDPEILQDFWLNHFGRFKGAFGEREPWYAYAYLVPFMLLPWAPYAAGAIVARLRGTIRFEPVWLFFVCWMTPGMVLLSLSTFKAKHYTMPLLPPLVVACAVGLHEYLKRHKAAPNRWLPHLLSLTLLSGAAGVGFIVWKRPTDWQAVAVVAMLLSIGTALAIVWEMRGRTALQLGTLFGTIGIAFVMVQVWIMPSHDSFRPLAELGRRASAQVPADAVVHLMFLPESQVHFYIDRPLRQRHSRDLYKDGANPTDVTLPVASEPYYIMTSIDFLPRFEAQGEVKVLDQGMRTSRHVYAQDRLALLEYRPKSAGATAAKAAAAGRK